MGVKIVSGAFDRCFCLMYRLFNVAEDQASTLVNIIRSYQIYKQIRRLLDRDTDLGREGGQQP